LRFWDPKSGENIRELKVHSGQISSVCLTPDGTYILSNSRDNTLKLIDIRTYDVVKTFSSDNYHNGVNWNRACISPDGTYIAAGTAEGKIIVWNANTGAVEKPVGDRDNEALIEGTSWHPIGFQVAAGDKAGALTIWD